MMPQRTVSSTPLTARQAEALSIVRAHYKHTGVALTVRGLSVAMRLSSSATAYGHLNVLERKGFVVRAEGKRGYIPVKVPA